MFSLRVRNILAKHFWIGSKKLGAKLTVAALIVSMTVGMPMMVAPAQADLEEGLKAYWPLDGDTLDNVGIFDGTGRGGELEYAAGMFGLGVDLNGNQDIEVTGGSEADFDFNTGIAADPNGGQLEFTVSVWAKREVFNKSWQAVIAKGEGNAWRMHRRGGSNRLAFHAPGDVSGPNNASTSINNDDWHNFIGVASLTGVRLYQDGLLIGSGGNVNTDPNRNNRVLIGGNPQGGGRQWNGLLDDVAIWDRALTQEDVDEIWNDGTGSRIIPLTVLNDAFTWDGSDGAWADPNWLTGDPPLPTIDFPQVVGDELKAPADSATIAAGTVNMLADQRAFSLNMTGGSLSLAPDTTLTTFSDVNAAGGEVTLGAGSSFVLIEGTATIGTVNFAGGFLNLSRGGTIGTAAITIEAGETTGIRTSSDLLLTAVSGVTGIEEGVATFVIEGSGTTILNRSGVDLADVTFDIRSPVNVLVSNVDGVDPLGGPAEIALNNGHLRIEQTDTTVTSTPGLLQEYLGGHGNPGNRNAFLDDFDNFADELKIGKGVDHTFWTGDRGGFDGPGGTPVVKYHPFTGESATGNVNNYKVRATGEILIPLDAPNFINFKDGVDDYTYLEIDGVALIDDNTWTSTDGAANNGSPIAELDVTGLQGEWLAIEFGMAEGGGGDSGLLFWDAISTVGFPGVPGDAIDLANNGKTLLVPDTHLRADLVAKNAINQPDYTINVASGTSQLEIVSDFASTIGTLILSDGILILSGTAPQLTFNSTIMGPEGSVGGVSTNGVLILSGTSGVAAGGRTGTLIKSGSGDAILNKLATGTENTTFQASGGRLIFVHDGVDNPAGDGAAFNLSDGGAIVLTSSAGDVVFNNRLNVNGAGTLQVGQAASGVDGPVLVTVGSPANGGTLGRLTDLEVRASNGYSLNLAGSIGGDTGAIRVTEGTVNLSAESSIGSVDVTGTGSVLNINAGLVTHGVRTPNQLIGSVFTGGNRDLQMLETGFGTPTSGLLGKTPIQTQAMTSRIHYQNDGEFRNGGNRGGEDTVGFSALQQNNNYQTSFSATFTMKEDGFLRLTTERNDDLTYIYLDLNQDGVFSVGDGERIVARNCCGNSRPGRFPLKAGDYLYLATHAEGGGGSQTQPTFQVSGTASTNTPRLTLSPGNPNQEGFWATATDTDPKVRPAAVNVSNGGVVNVNAKVTASQLNVLPGGTVNVNSGADFDIGLVKNEGSIVVKQGGVLDLSTVALVSDGSLVVAGGQLKVDPTTAATAPNHELQLQFGKVETPGDLPVGFGNQFFGAVLNVPSGLEVTVGAMLDVKPLAIVAMTGGKLNVGSISNQGHIALLSGELNYTGGDISANNAGPFGSTVDIGSGMHLRLSGSLLIPDGGVVNSNGNITAAGMNVAVGGVFNAIGSTITATSDGLAGGPDGVVNNGVINVINTTFDSDVHSTAGSVINVASGVIIKGHYSGAGRFDGIGGVDLQGDVSLGDSTASVPFGGSLTLSRTVFIELGGTAVGLFDQFVVAENVTLNATATLDVSLFGGFVLDPAVDYSFPIIVNGGTTTGQFAGLAQGATVDVAGSAVDLLITYEFGDDGNDVALVSSLPPDFSLADLDTDGDVDADDLFAQLGNWNMLGLGDIVIDLDPLKAGVNSDDLFFLLSEWTGPLGGGGAPAAVADAAVPEPSTFVLALLALLGLGIRRRRRNRTA